MTLGSLPGHSEQGTTSASSSSSLSFPSQSSQTLCFPRIITSHGEQVKCSISLLCYISPLLFDYSNWNVKCVSSLEKSHWMWSVVFYEIYSFSIQVWGFNKTDLFEPVMVRTRTHFSTLIISTQQSQSLLLLIMGENYYTTTFILSECSFVGKSNPALSDTHCWEHKPRAAIGHHQARRPLRLCS